MQKENGVKILKFSILIWPLLFYIIGGIFLIIWLILEEVIK